MAKLSKTQLPVLHPELKYTLVVGTCCYKFLTEVLTLLDLNLL